MVTLFVLENVSLDWLFCAEWLTVFALFDVIDFEIDSLSFVSISDWWLNIYLSVFQATPTVAGMAAIAQQYFREGYYPTGFPNNNRMFHIADIDLAHVVFCFVLIFVLSLQKLIW